MRGGALNVRRLTFTGFAVFFIAVHSTAKHHYKSEQRQQTAHPYCGCSEPFYTHISEYCAYHKDEYRAVIEQNLFSILGLAAVIIINDRLSARAEIADAHGRGDLTAVYLAEALHLYAA